MSNTTMSRFSITSYLNVQSFSARTLLILFIFIFPHSAANAERWFEIELIVFTRDDNVEQGITETFPEHIQAIKTNRARDLISNRFPKNAKPLLSLLPQCEEPSPHVDKQYQPNTIITPIETINTLTQHEADTFNQYTDIANIDTGSQATNPVLSSKTPSNNGLNTSRPHGFTFGPNGKTPTVNSPSNNTVIQRNEETNPHLDAVITNAKSLHASISLLKQPIWNDGGNPLDCIPQWPLAVFSEGEKYRNFETILKRDQLPLRLDAKQPSYSSVPYLLADSSLQFVKEVQKLMWRDDITPVLHMGWRQPIKSQRKEKPWRLYAGKNFTEQFDYYGDPVQPITFSETLNVPPVIKQQDQNSHAYSAYSSSLEQPTTLDHASIMRNINNLVEKVESGEWQASQAQQQNTLEEWQQQNKRDGVPNQVWQIDGLFKIYLRHYLFIETNFNYREIGTHPSYQPETQSSDTQNYNDELDDTNATALQQSNEYLYAIPFTQSRRIRSGEIHYFDHPKMGMILQVRKYTPPNKP